jgi:hypothetical protein
MVREIPKDDPVHKGSSNPSGSSISSGDIKQTYPPPGETKR